ncbi:COMPASS component SDC1 [Paramyrothecium foliicola]|nr:COMPASS component SDC1 [Paramyrothecium foliicola]
MSDPITKDEAQADPPLGPVIDELPSATSAVQDVQSTDVPQRDIVMSDAPVDQAASPAPVAHAPSPAPARTGTPAHGSRAASVHPDSGFTMPSEAPLHGDQVRQYLNTRVTGVLLEGMKQLAKEQPSEPLRVLGEYLLQRSKELEGTI